MNDVIIVAQSLTKIYDQMTDYLVKSLDHVSLEVKDGEFIAIMGPSGSGKTTLIQCLSTMDQPTDGQVYLYGQPLSHFTDYEICQFRNQKIGFIFQDYQLLDYLTIEENIAFPLSMNNVPTNKIKERVQKISYKIGVEDILKKYPGECSGGQKQRVAIARAFIGQPEMIIADEPTGNLDSQNTFELMNILKAFHEKERKTIVLVTHDVMVASYASRLLYIQDGKITEQLHRDDFQNQNEYFKHIVKLNSQERYMLFQNG